MGGSAEVARSAGERLSQGEFFLVVGLQYELIALVGFQTYLRVAG